MEDPLFVPTQSLLCGLAKNEEAPWSEADFTARRLALRLKKFGIKPRQNPAGTARGYYRSDFKDAFSRYLPSEASEASDTAPEQDKRSDASKASDGLNRQTETTRQDETAGQDTFLTELTLLTDTLVEECISDTLGLAPQPLE